MMISLASCANNWRGYTENNLEGIFDSYVLGRDVTWHKIGVLNGSRSEKEERLFLIETVVRFGLNNSWADAENAEWSPVIKRPGFRGALCIKIPSVAVVFIKDGDNTIYLVVGGG